MRQHIYTSKDTQATIDAIPNLSLSLLVRTVLAHELVFPATVRVVATTPSPTPAPRAFTLPEQYPVLDIDDSAIVLYSPTIADMDRLQATSVRLEWYDEGSESWMPSGQ